MPGPGVYGSMVGPDGGEVVGKMTVAVAVPT